MHLSGTRPMGSMHRRRARPRQAEVFSISLFAAGVTTQSRGGHVARELTKMLKVWTMFHFKNAC